MIFREKKCPFIKLASAKFMVVVLHLTGGYTNTEQYGWYFCGGGRFPTSLAGIKTYKLARHMVLVPSVGAALNNQTAPRWLTMKFY